ncbi:hypothetical protein [Haloferula sp. BvORR071]|nr:hypothetical protein [Haloferula sp. BvORR071]
MGKSPKSSANNSGINAFHDTIMIYPIITFLLGAAVLALAIMAGNLPV